MTSRNELTSLIKSQLSRSDRVGNEMTAQVLSAGRPLESWGRLDANPIAVSCTDSLAEALDQLQQRNFQAAVFSLPRFGSALVPFLHNAREARPLAHFILLADGATESLAANLADTVPDVSCLPASSSPMMIRMALERAIQLHQAALGRNKGMEGAINGTISAFIEILSLVDPYSASLGQRLRYAVEAFTREARLPLTWELETAAMLSEVGVLTIPVRVLLRHNSSQDLSGFEKGMIARVPERGADLLHQITFLQPVARLVRYHQKHFDGGGFPSDSLAGERLPRGSRILKILSDLSRLEDNGLSRERAIEHMQQTAGKYDPSLLEIARKLGHVDLPARVPATAQLVTLKELRPGHLLVAGVETKDGVLLIREGQIVSPKIIHKLRNFACMSGIKEPIHVVDLLESRKMINLFQDMAHSDTSIFIRNRADATGEFAP